MPIYLTWELKTTIMGLFKRNKVELTTVCKICGMEFTDPERTMRHMTKAHSKPCKSKGCNC